MPVYPASRGAVAAAIAAVIYLAACSPRPAAAFRGQRAANEVGAPLETSVTALKASHAAITARLPKNLQHSERRSFAIVSQLPLVLQEAYLRTGKGYASLGMEDQHKFADLVQTLGSLPRSSQSRAVAILNAQFKGAKVTPEKIEEARKHPHETCFLINKAIAQATGRKH